MIARAWLKRGGVTTVAAVLVGGALVVIPAVDPVPETPRTTVDQTAISGGQTVRPGFSKAVTGDANLVGVRWTGNPDATFIIERRGDDGRWHDAGETKKTDVLPDPGSADARHMPAGFASEPVWLGDDASAVRVKLVGGTARNLSLQRVVAPRAAGSSAVAGATISNPPGMISRAAWGADEGLRLRNCPEGPTYDSQLQLAIVHHTDNANNYSPDQAFQLMRSIYAYHTRSLGYCDIAYSFLIDRFGRVFEGRYGGTGQVVRGAHSIGFNTNSVGIAVIGNFQGAAPSGVAVDALEALIAWKFGVHHVDPTTAVAYNTGGNDKFPPGPLYLPSRIIGHRDTWFTDCPGQGLYEQLPAIRASVNVRVYTAPPDQWFGWFGVAGQPKAMSVSGFGSFYPAGGQPWQWLPGYWPGWNIIRDVEITTNGGVYELDGFGGIHSSGAPPISGGPYFGFDVARDLTVIPGTTSGYVLDAWGGIHEFGGAPRLQASGYWAGWDIVRRMTLAPGGAYVMTAWGSTFAASQGGSSPASLGATPYWPGWDIARDIKTRPGVPGAYILDGYGAVHAVGGAPGLGSPYFGYDNAIGLGFATGTSGGYVASRNGQVYPFGGAPGLAQPGIAFPANVRGFSVTS